MRRRCLFIGVAILLVLSLAAVVTAQKTVKWSAPMHEYPNPWNPTAPPQAYYQNYGYQHPYYAYGYGYGNYPGYGGYPGYGRQPGYGRHRPASANVQGGYAGNPYYGNYYYR